MVPLVPAVSIPGAMHFDSYMPFDFYRSSWMRTAQIWSQGSLHFALYLKPIPHWQMLQRSCVVFYSPTKHI